MDLCRTKNYGMSADPNNNLWFLVAKDFGKSTYKGKGVLRYEQKNLGESIVASVTGENKIF